MFSSVVVIEELSAQASALEKTAAKVIKLALSDDVLPKLKTEMEEMKQLYECVSSLDKAILNSAPDPSLFVNYETASRSGFVFCLDYQSQLLAVQCQDHTRLLKWNLLAASPGESRVRALSQQLCCISYASSWKVLPIISVSSLMTLDTPTPTPKELWLRNVNACRLLWQTTR